MNTTDNRIHSIDFYRGIAVLAVLFFHFNGSLPYGYLGVDLFFIISGFLIGGILIRSFNNGKINFLSFFLKRSFKIFPSYYFFLLVGGVLSYFLYHKINPESVLSLSDIKRYFFFYRNYTGLPNHWNFDHLWSLCVEEHFYVLFPVSLIILLKIGVSSKKYLFLIIVVMIILGFVFKNFSLFFTNGKDTYAATHNRLDSLGYGVLLYLLNDKYTKILVRPLNWMLIIFGVIGVIFSIYIDSQYNFFYYEKTIFQSIIPLFFMLILLGSLKFRFSKFSLIKKLATYSYNLYLWHPMFVFVVVYYFNATLLGFVIYSTISILFAYLTTTYIELPALSYRNRVVEKIIKR